MKKMKTWELFFVTLVIGSPTLAVLTNHPIGLFIGLFWGLIGWLAYCDTQQKLNIIQKKG